MNRIHTTCIALEGQAILLRGASGSGKSDLALRLMDEGWSLVADDYTEIKVHDGQLHASPPDTLKGLLEVRGIGLIQVAYVKDIPIVAAFDLLAFDDIERLPESTYLTLESIDVPLYTLHGHETSAPAKIRIALKAQAENLFYNLKDEDT